MLGVTVFTFTDPILASDFKMPRLNGMEFLKMIKETNRFVRTILMTAFTIDDKMFLEHTKNKIINVFLQKPIIYMTF